MDSLFDYRSRPSSPGTIIKDKHLCFSLQLFSCKLSCPRGVNERTGELTCVRIYMYVRACVCVCMCACVPWFWHASATFMPIWADMTPRSPCSSAQTGSHHTQFESMRPRTGGYDQVGLWWPLISGGGLVDGGAISFCFRVNSTTACAATNASLEIRHEVFSSSFFPSFVFSTKQKIARLIMY